MSVTGKILRLLKGSKIDLLEHKPTLTSQEAANVRGQPLSNGAKALVMKVDDNFKLFVIRADLKIDSKAVKKYFKAKKLRFATKNELFKLTGLFSGSVPPFGKPVLPFDLYIDESITNNELMSFNAGSLTMSITMSVSDYLRISKPICFKFSKT